MHRALPFRQSEPGRIEKLTSNSLIFKELATGRRRMQTDLSTFFNLRRRSLIRGNALVFTSLMIAVFLSDFPHNRATLLLLLPVSFAIAGTAETLRCLQRRWSFYHAGVMLCVYMDLMAVSIIVFLLVYPYWHFLSAVS